MRQVSMGRLTRMFAWIGLSSIGGGRSAYIYDTLVERHVGPHAEIALRGMGAAVVGFLCVTTVRIGRGALLGGGLGVVPEMQRQVVGIHGWLTARQFVDGYALAQVTPGPGMLVSAFIGYRVNGLLGALVAMTAMFLPTCLLTWFVARRWQRQQGRPWALAVERGLASLAIGLMAAGVYTVGRSALTDLPTTLLAVAACITLAKRWLPAAGVVLAAGIVSYLLGALIP